MNSHFNKEIIELIYRTIKPDLVLLFVRNNDDLNLVASIGNDLLVSQENTPQHKIDECLCGIATRNGKPMYSLDIQTDPNCTWHECKKAGMRSFASLPLLHDDNVIGILGIGSISPRDFSEHASILEPLAAAISISLKNNILLAEHKKAEVANSKTLAFLETLLKSSPMGIRVFEGDSGSCLLVNQAAAEISGGSIEEMLQQNFRELASWKNAGMAEISEKVLSDGIARPFETDMISTFGRQIAARYYLSRFYVENKPHLMVIGRDATEEKRLEDQKKLIESQMLHVQKLESLGVLAGGIAHDFNNILMAIIGNADLALMTMTSGQPGGNYIHEIKHAARRAADLAHQMLAYSGKGHFIIEPLDINKSICEITALLDVSVSKKASLNLELADNLPCVKADSTQLCQIIMNLVINASEAIEDNNGNIIIKTGAMDCSRSFFSNTWIDDKLPEGKYVYVQVTDTGCGMDQSTQARLFEPFFTTKFTGRGLGMSAVLGIIRGHKGTITVHSEPGKGSTFKVYLPATECTENSSLTQAVYEEQGLNMTGTFLLVDDEEIIRHMVSSMLEMFGFKVLMASDGIEALEKYKQSAGEIVCVLLDLTMPRMDGEQTFLQLRRMNPELPIIISSGFGEQDIADKFIKMGLAYFIQKPYQMNKLEQKINEVLGINIPRP